MNSRACPSKSDNCPPKVTTGLLNDQSNLSPYFEHLHDDLIPDQAMLMVRPSHAHGETTPELP